MLIPLAISPISFESHWKLAKPLFAPWLRSNRKLNLSNLPSEALNDKATNVSSRTSIESSSTERLLEGNVGSNFLQTSSESQKSTLVLEALSLEDPSVTFSAKLSLAFATCDLAPFETAECLWSSLRFECHMCGEQVGAALGRVTMATRDNPMWRSWEQEAVMVITGTSGLES